MDKIYIKKEELCQMNEKGKDTIILQSIIKMNNKMEVNNTEYKGENCIYYKRKILHDMKTL